MARGRRTSLAAVVVILWTCAAAVGAAPVLGAGPVSIASDGEPIRVVVADGATSAVVPITLESAGRVRERRSPRFTLSALQATSLPAMPVPAATLAVRFAGTDVTNGGFVVPGAGLYAAELEIGGITTDGRFSANLLAAEGAGSGQVLAELEIVRLPAADLQLVGFTGGQRTLVVRGPNVSVPLVVRSMNLADAVGVRLDVDTLRTEAGVEADVVAGSPGIPPDMAGLAVASLELQVTLPEPGRFAAPVHLTWNGSTTSFLLTIDWATAPLGVDVISVQGAATTIPACVRFLVSLGDCELDAVWITLRESAGRTTTVDSPQLVSLAKVEGSSSVGVPSISAFTVLECAPASPSPGTGPAPGASASPDPGSCGRAVLDPVTNEITLGPSAVARVRVSLLGDLNAGQYAVQLTSSGENRTPVDSTTAIFLRVPWPPVLVLFLLACWAGLPVRRFLTVGRAALVHQGQLARITSRLEDQLPSARTDEARALVREVIQVVLAAYDDLGRGILSPTAAGPVVEEMDLRARTTARWVALPLGRLSAADIQELGVIRNLLVSGDRLTADARQRLEGIDRIVVPVEEMAITGMLRRRTPPRVRRSAADQLRAAVVKKLAWGSRVETLLIVTLTAISGVALVWAPNATWGSWPDILTAVLWALGVQSVATASFAGVIGMQARLRDPAPTP